MRKFIVFVSIIGLLLLGACSKEEVKEVNQPKKQEDTRSDKKELTELVKLNLESSEKEDLDSYLGTLKSGGDDETEVRRNIQTLFENFQLDYELLSVEDVSVEGKTALATVKHSVKAIEKKEGYQFKDSVLTTIYSFEKIDGKWKIANNDVYEIIPFEEYVPE